nr:hypothetical protein [Tanacetum cinerariifolium]
MSRDTIQLENALSTISQEYLLEFTSEYRIPEGLHPELPGPRETIVDFPEGKVVIGAAKVSHIEINCRVLNIVPTLNLCCMFYIPSFNSRWMSFSKRPEKNTPQCYRKPMDSLKNWNNRFFWVDEKIFPTVVDWCTGAPNDGMQATNLYSAADVTLLDTHRTPIKKQPEFLLCLVGLSRRYFLGDDVYLTFLDDDDRDMDLFNLISASNPTKVRTETRPRAAHEVSLLTVSASRVIEMEDVVVASESSGTPSTLEMSPLDFANEDPPQTITERGGAEDQVQDEVAYEIPTTENASNPGVALETGLEKEVASMGPHVNKRRRKRGNNEAEANATSKVLRRDHDAFRPAQSTHEGKSLASMGLDAGSHLSTPAAQDPSTATKSVSDPEPLPYANPQSHPEQDIAQSSEGTTTEIPTEDAATAGLTSSSPWGVPNQGDLPLSISWLGHRVVSTSRAPPGYFPELRHLPNANFLSQYNTTLARQVAMGSRLRLRFEQEVRLLKKARSKIVRQDLRIQVRDEEIKKLDQEMYGLQNHTKNLKTLLEAEVDMKKVAEAKSAKLAKELDSLRVMGEEKIKAAFEEFKKYEDDKVEQWCVEMDARLDKLSVDFDEELYLHMLTAIVGRRWVIGHGLRLAVMKCAESSEIRRAFADVVSAGLAKESDIGEDAPQWIHELRPSSSQLKIHMYLEVRDPEDLWAVKKEMLLEDAIAANISRAKKKKMCRVVCRTHGIGSAHHAKSDGIPVSVPTVPQGLAILLADAATQTEAADQEEPYPRL